jgi:hypothetical protein
LLDYGADVDPLVAAHMMQKVIAGRRALLHSRLPTAAIAGARECRRKSRA